jgi:hypothetical protein
MRAVIQLQACKKRSRRRGRCSVQSATRWPMQMQHYGTERVVDAPKLYLTLYAEYLLNTHTFILKLTPCICALVQMNCNFEYM